MRSVNRVAAALVSAALVAASLVACSGSGDAAAPTYSEADTEAALQEESKITVWSWAEAHDKAVAELFMAEYPAITVDVQNVGTGGDQYTKLLNAIKAGSGGPDIALIEYQALSTFAVSKSLANLEELGFAGLEDKYTPGSWSNVSFDGAMQAVPFDSGAMNLYYNKRVLDEHGFTEPPATWDDYIEIARTIHAADPDSYIANDNGNAFMATSLIWQAGGTPFTIDGETITVNLQDEGTKRWAEMWGQLTDEGLLSDMNSWNDEWYKALTDGSIYTLLAGAWMSASLMGGVPGGAGEWRIAPLPTYPGQPDRSSEMAGATHAVMAKSANPLVAAAFLKFMSLGDGAQVHVDRGGVPATVAALNDPAFLEKKFDYFGGQEVNRFILASAEKVAPGWSFLPFQTHANTMTPATLGQSFLNRTDLNEGLIAWQEAIIAYGEEQGYTMVAGD